MQIAINQFKLAFDNINAYKQAHSSIASMVSPIDLSDMLRWQLVYSVSALDKFIHQLVQFGMVDVFKGNRSKTPSFEKFPMTLEEHFLLLNSQYGAPEIAFERIVVNKNKHLSFQDPDKINEGLALIWDEKQRWQKIASKLGYSDQDIVKKKLKTIVSRRNQIVHEADFDIITHEKLEIDQSDIDDLVPFIHDLGYAIYELVKE